MVPWQADGSMILTFDITGAASGYTCMRHSTKTLTAFKPFQVGRPGKSVSGSLCEGKREGKREGRCWEWTELVVQQSCV